METITIRYCFKFGNDESEVFDVHLAADTLEVQGNIPDILPDWVNLDFFQCPHCPLDTNIYPYCPVAANLVNILRRFDSLLSYHQTHLVVTTKDRIISQVTTVQRAVSSLTGLVIAASGCPQTAFFKPMARFHLPLASNEETIYRAASMYLLAQYFKENEGKKPDFDLKGLEDIYNNIRLVNRTMADRLREAAKTDSLLNAIVQLDIYAQTLSAFIDESLKEIRYLFDAYLEETL